MVVREQGADHGDRTRDPGQIAISVLGLDVDNDSAFINETPLNSHIFRLLSFV